MIQKTAKHASNSYKQPHKSPVKCEHIHMKQQDFLLTRGLLICGPAWLCENYPRQLSHFSFLWLQHQIFQIIKLYYELHQINKTVEVSYVNLTREISCYSPILYGMTLLFFCLLFKYLGSQAEKDKYCLASLTCDILKKKFFFSSGTHRNEKWMVAWGCGLGQMGTGW